MVQNDVGNNSSHFESIHAAAQQAGYGVRESAVRCDLQSGEFSPADSVWTEAAVVKFSRALVQLQAAEKILLHTPDSQA